MSVRSENDTGNNPHNPMYGIYRAGADGSLATLVGSRASDSGGNSMAPAGLIDLSVRPTKVDRASDVTGLVDTGQLASLLSVPAHMVVSPTNLAMLYLAVVVVALLMLGCVTWLIQVKPSAKWDAASRTRFRRG